MTSLQTACILLSALVVSLGGQSCECGVFSYPNPVVRSNDSTEFKGLRERKCLKGGSDLVSIAASEPECRKLCEEESDCEGYEVSGKFCRTVRHAKMINCHKESTSSNIRDPPKMIDCPLVTEAGKNQNPFLSTPLPEYPRPQEVRDYEDLHLRWVNLNGFWEFEAAGSGNASHPPPFPKVPLGSKIVVPYPPESCLSGIWVNHYGNDKIPQSSDAWTTQLWYRRKVDLRKGKKTLIHFEASDWTTFVYANRKLIGKNIGGYNPFSFELPEVNEDSSIEILVFVFDPTDYGHQVAGKQRITAILQASGDTYTPSSGIWQTVWLEEVPTTRISNVVLTPTLNSISLDVSTEGIEALTLIQVHVYKPKTTEVIAAGIGKVGEELNISIPDALNWSPDIPNLYNCTIALVDGQGQLVDRVRMYFALRVFSMSMFKNDVGKDVLRPTLNGKKIFASGWLDQSWFPDGMYTPATLEILEGDLLYAKEMGFNMIRLHQKINPRTFYAFADKIGIMIYQDMPQHYTDAHGIKPDTELFKSEVARIISSRVNCPSIVQWILFNEKDMVLHFNVSEVIDIVHQTDTTNSRLIDAMSGGPTNINQLGNVQDIHHYPYPIDINITSTQYAMAGEWGGIALFATPSHQWLPGRCYGFTHATSPADVVRLFSAAINDFIPKTINTSASVITGSTDIERECDGYFTYDRIRKLNSTYTSQMAAVNMKLINSV